MGHAFLAIEEDQWHVEFLGHGFEVFAVDVDGAVGPTLDFALYGGDCVLDFLEDAELVEDAGYTWVYHLFN
jgi:hypothetical protein